MKKTNNIYGLLGILALILLGAGFGLLAAPAVETAELLDTASGYDFVFGNNAFAALESSGVFVASFVLMIIAAAFQLLAIVFSFGKSHRFAGFLHLLAGIMAAISGVIVFLTPTLAPQVVPNGTYLMAWGTIATGAAVLAGAVISLALALKGLFLAKKN